MTPHRNRRRQRLVSRGVSVALTKVPVTFACGPYDRMEALSLGIVQPEGIELRYISVQSPPELFARMVKTRSFDVSEMSLAHYFAMRLRDKAPFIAIPVFPSRMFRHGYVFINKRSGIDSPQDLSGRRIGIRAYLQCSAVWIRGILAHEYDVNLDNVRWVEGGVNMPGEPDEEVNLPPIGKVPIEPAPAGRDLSGMLERGEIEAYFGALRPNSLRNSANVARLFPDYRDVERDYYRRTGIHPIMNTIVVREELYEANPWIADSLYKACQESKHWALKQMKFSGAQRWMLPWMFDEIAEMMDMFEGNPWPYGLEPNRHTLKLFMRFMAEQKLIDAPAPIDDLFTPVVGWTE
jgi:4,5-dihydroxyphthalate decarboxylase